MIIADQICHNLIYVKYITYKNNSTIILDIIQSIKSNKPLIIVHNNIQYSTIYKCNM